eukprot:TRINITY_DN18808_c0_g1_i1.p1 TRINITY_DN18808_c0_g1~~TRINITY_DN18808_c0_g1_i1.p1  ORF type:complete len:747 (-),score=116.11 TRINITY_DN18808_c0_g1_i1:236-2476(-)
MALLSLPSPLTPASPRLASHASPTWGANKFAANIRMKRSTSSPTKSWQLHLEGSYEFPKRKATEDDLGSLAANLSPKKAQYVGEDKAVAVLAPSADSVLPWSGPMVPPWLVRGSHTVLPKPARPERFVWPHTAQDAQPDEVSLFFEGAGVAPPVILPKARACSSPESHMAGERSSLLPPRIQTEGELSPTSQHAGVTLWERRAQPRGGPLGATGGDAMRLFAREDTPSSPSRPMRNCFSDGQLNSNLPPLSPDGRGRSEAELVMMHSLRTRTSELHWETSIISKPPMQEQELSKPVWPRPAKTPAFLRAMERARTQKWIPEIRGREKAGKLLGVHSEMRRAGQAKDEASEVSKKNPHSGCTACIVGVKLKELNPTPDEIKLREENTDGSGITRALAGCNDTTESLERGIDLLKNSSGSIEKYGGLRHPTSLISIRTLGVLIRKLEVVTPYEIAVKHLESLTSNKKRVLEQVRDGADIKRVAGPAWNIKEKIIAATHPTGRPQDDDRAAWDIFVTTFRLPSEHHLIVLGWKLVRGEAPVWAEMCLEMAESMAEKEAKNPDACRSPESPAADSAKRVFDFLVGINVDSYRPEMDRTFAKFCAARAKAVSRYAECEAAKDKPNEGKKDKADEALKHASNIYSAMKAAIFWGVDPGDPELKPAKDLHVHLRAQRVGRFAQLTMDTLKEGVPGSAAKVADLIDEAVSEAADAMQDARTLSLQARSEEKRLERKLERKKEAEQKMQRKTELG